ncbi:hypothetical protein AB1Y20_021898 [Prymnesium parvum]|uniref:Uncharacterized protein n=1 Tax=Prymnesium parvum TaxID=97485 RepID=A0AB34JHV9_PRYPA
MRALPLLSPLADPCARPPRSPRAWLTSKVPPPPPAVHQRNPAAASYLNEWLQPDGLCARCASASASASASPRGWPRVQRADRPSAKREAGETSVEGRRGKEDAAGLKAQLEAMLGQGGGHEKVDEAWDGAFAGLVELSHVTSHERGKLLDEVRAYFSTQLKEARAKVKLLQREVQAMKREKSVLMGEAAPAGSTPRGASLEQQRLQILEDATAKLSDKDKCALIDRMLRSMTWTQQQAFFLSWQQRLAQNEQLELIHSLFERLQPLDVMQVLATVSEHASSAQRTRLMMLFVQQDNASEKARQAGELVHRLDQHARAALARSVFVGLEKVDRQPTVMSLLRSLSREEREEALLDVLADLSLSETTQLVADRVLTMSVIERHIFVSEMLSTQSRAETMQVVQEQLVAMTPQERGPLLGELFGTIFGDERTGMIRKLCGPASVA